MENLNIDNDSEIVYEYEPLHKRIKTQVLTYLRQNYLNIFKFLLLIVLLLIVTIIVLLVKPGDEPKTATADPTCTTISPQSVEKKERLEFVQDTYAKILHAPHEVSASATTVLAPVEEPSPSDEKISNKRLSYDDVSSKVQEEPLQLGKIPCGRINCRTENNFCAPKDYEYRTIKRFVCCCKDLIPDSVVFQRYMKNRLSNTVSLIFRTGIDLTKLSALDLKYFQQLQNLTGVWSVVQESDTEYYLQYNLVNPPNSDDPDEA